MQKNILARRAGLLRWAVVCLTLIFAALYVAARVGLDVGVLKVALGSHWSPNWWSGILGDLGVALLVIALFRLIQMLGLMASGETFSTALVRRFRAFAFWLLLSAAIGFLNPMIAGLARPEGSPIRLMFDFRQLLIFAITLVLFLVAGLFERARELEDEAREIV